MDAIKEKKLAVMGECPTCSLPVTLAHKRRGILEAGQAKRTWYHQGCTFNLPKVGGSVEVEDPTTTTTSNGNSNGTNHNDAETLKALIERIASGTKQAATAIDSDALKTAMDSLKLELTAYIKDNLPKPTILEIHQDDKPNVTIENPHKLFPKLLYHISKRNHVYMHGPVGSGKSTAAMQAATALSLDYGYISLCPQTAESRLQGFIDANGVFRDPIFYRLFKNGGVMCIDEGDNASAQLLTTLNSLLENGHGSFPGGMVERHKDFVLVMTGNTNGRGANAAFPDRRSFDAAFGERFIFVDWQYDTRLELAIAQSIAGDLAKPWVNYVWELREYCRTNHPKLVVSPRASIKGAMYLKDIKEGKYPVIDKENPIDDLCESLIYKGFDKDSLKSIKNAVSLPSLG